MYVSGMWDQVEAGDTGGMFTQNTFLVIVCDNNLILFCDIVVCIGFAIFLDMCGRPEDGDIDGKIYHGCCEPKKQISKTKI